MGYSNSLRRAIALLAGLALAGAAPALAQVETIDPNAAYATPQSAAQAAPVGAEAGTQADVPAGDPAARPSIDAGGAPGTPGASEAGGDPAASTAADPAGAAGSDQTYREDDLIGAAEGVFGKGAQGLAMMIQDLLKKQGEPNGYIVGREGGGAFVFGVRYGSGTLFHKVEGQRPVYWTGPSVGIDAGANVGNTFVLVYNLYDSEDLYKRFGAAEGQAYLLGGFNASYLRSGDVVLIPIRMGAGLRLGLNAGYMKFSQKQKWLPF